MRSSLKAYALGIVALAVAVTLRWLLDPLMGDALPLVTLFGAVAAAARYLSLSITRDVDLLGVKAPFPRESGVRSLPLAVPQLLDIVDVVKLTATDRSSKFLDLH